MKTNIEKLNVHFVKLVETNPCIWDSRSKDYRNKKLVRFAWDRIAKEINEPVENLPERWRKIRDALFRSIKRHSIKNDRKKRKPYYLTSHLCFLLPFSNISNNTTITKNNSLSLEEYDTDEDSKPGPFLEDNKTNEATKSFQNDTELESNTSTMQLCEQPATIKTDIDETRNNEQYFKIFDEEESALSTISKRLKLNEEEDENDSDMNFFKSLLRDVRKMDDRQNRKFRLRVLQVVDEIFEHYDSEEERSNDLNRQNQTLLRSQRRQKRK